MPGAADHAVRFASGLLDCPFNFIHQKWIHRDCLLAQQNFMAHGQSPTLRNIFCLRIKSIQRLPANFIRAMTNIKRHPDLAGDNIGRTRLCLNLPHCRHQPWNFLRLMLDVQ